MAADSISLLAQNAYSQIQSNSSIKAGRNVEFEQAENFQNIVKQQFNNFTSLSPTQILNHIQNTKITNSDTIGQSKTPISSSLTVLRQELNKQEDLVRKSLINQASIVDVLIATTDAKTALMTMVTVRDKFIEAYDKILNMPI